MVVTKNFGDVENGEVVCVSSGTKCINGEQLSLEGKILKITFLSPELFDCGYIANLLASKFHFLQESKAILKMMTNLYLGSNLMCLFDNYQLALNNLWRELNTVACINFEEERKL